MKSNVEGLQPLRKSVAGYRRSRKGLRMKKITNKQYIAEFTNSRKVAQKMLQIMFKYGENRWWLSSDFKKIGYHQLKEDTLLVDFEKFHKGVELLFQRRLSYYELLSNLEELREESNIVWKKKVM
jgi:hypothetical protein